MIDNRHRRVMQHPPPSFSSSFFGKKNPLESCMLDGDDDDDALMSNMSWMNVSLLIFFKRNKFLGILFSRFFFRCTGAVNIQDTYTLLKREIFNTQLHYITIFCDGRGILAKWQKVVHCINLSQPSIKCEMWTVFSFSLFCSYPEGIQREACMHITHNTHRSKLGYFSVGWRFSIFLYFTEAERERMTDWLVLWIKKCNGNSNGNAFIFWMSWWRTLPFHFIQNWDGDGSWILLLLYKKIKQKWNWLTFFFPKKKLKPEEVEF